LWKERGGGQRRTDGGRGREEEKGSFEMEGHRMCTGSIGSIISTEGKVRRSKVGLPSPPGLDALAAHRLIYRGRPTRVRAEGAKHSARIKEHGGV